ncbi:MAG: hypothetical protein IPI48_18080 [bacterium]|nr:hypothetical protein [bacterium]
MPARLLENHEPLPANVAGVARMLILGLLLIACLAPAIARAQPALFRVNAGGDAQAPLNGGVGWDVDTAAAPSAYHVAGSNVAAFAGGTFHPSVPAGTPPGIFDTERWDPSGGEAMQWNFPVGSAGTYEVRLYFKNGYTGTSTVGTRVFNVLIEGVPVLTNYDIIADVGHQVAIMKSFVVTSDANLDIDFQHVVENPLINGIEIVAVSTEGYLLATPSALDFGMVEVGTPAALPLTLRNLGSTTGIAIDPFTVATDFQASFGGMVLAPGASTVVMVTFDPAIGSGATQESLAITHDGSNSPLGVPLGGFSFDPGAAPIAFNGHTLVGTGSNNPTSLEFRARRAPVRQPAGRPDQGLHHRAQRQRGNHLVHGHRHRDHQRGAGDPEPQRRRQRRARHHHAPGHRPGRRRRRRQPGHLRRLFRSADRGQQRLGTGHQFGHHLASDLDRFGLGPRAAGAGPAAFGREPLHQRPRSRRSGQRPVRHAGRQHEQGRPEQQFLAMSRVRALGGAAGRGPGHARGHAGPGRRLRQPVRPGPGHHRRPDASGQPDANDPFGGNNGLNQAIWDPTGRCRSIRPATATPTTSC